ncbi:MAG TPA: hypothetical protein VIK72_11485 [Clostridiaceae bacterium]
MNNHENKHGPMNHMLMMVICCGLPVLLLIALPFIGIFGAGFKLTLGTIIPFLCPVMMLLMIPMMLKSNKNGKSCCDEKKEETDISKIK